MKKLTLPEFIENLLLPDLEKMVGVQLHYYAFSVMCQAIEIMGASIDDQDFSKFDLCE